MCKFAINNGCNTQVVHILREECDGAFIFKGDLLNRLPKSVEPSHDWALKSFKYQEPNFKLDYLII